MQLAARSSQLTARSSAHSSQLAARSSQLAAQLTAHSSQLTAHSLQLTARSSQLTAHSSQLAAQLAARSSQLAARSSQLAARSSQLAGPDLCCNMPHWIQPECSYSLLDADHCTNCLKLCVLIELGAGKHTPRGRTDENQSSEPLHRQGQLERQLSAAAG